MDYNDTDSRDAQKAVRSFWLLGLLNNAPWVLMLACATNISAGGVALVFISNQIPGLLVKLTSPYWFHNVSYKRRMQMASLAMGIACFLVGLGGFDRDEVSGEGGDGEKSDVTGENNEESEGQHGSLGLALELIGVSFISFQSGLGEASLLALAGKFDSTVISAPTSSDTYLVINEQQSNSDLSGSESNNENDFAEQYQNETNEELTSNNNDVKLMKHNEHKLQRRCITAFASGTGLAGIVGYGYKALLAEIFGWGLSYIVWSVIIFAFSYWRIFVTGLHDMELISRNGGADTSSQQQSDTIVASLLVGDSEIRSNSNATEGHNGKIRSSGLDENHRKETEFVAALEMVGHHSVDNPQPNNEEESSPSSLDQRNSAVTVDKMSSFERFKLVLSLWPYTIPLFTVYSAEYMLQAGVWSAIGFPVTSARSRSQFYQYSNWMYQSGVFVSRSSGNVCTASIQLLWLMPFLQVVNLVFFWLVSVHHFWYNYALLVPCFYAGLLGGGVYVQGFSRINADFPLQLREFAISSASVADGFGILLADILSLFIQSCIYKRNGIDGAVVTCPL